MRRVVLPLITGIQLILLMDNTAREPFNQIKEQESKRGH